MSEITIPLSGVDTLSETRGLSNESYYKQTQNFYDDCSKVYDYLYPDHLKYSRKLFEKLIPEFKVKGIKRILDASCGVGHDMSILLEAGFEVDGSDSSSGMVNKAKLNLQNRFAYLPNIFLMDVRNIVRRQDIHDRYDAILFRGNTFSNIAPMDVPKTIKGLLMSVRKGGSICIDYRNGRPLFQERKKFELRNFSFNRKRKELITAYYKLKHPEEIESPYFVNAHIYRWKISNIAETAHHTIEIYSNYVLEKNILDVLHEEGVDYEYVIIEKPKLPHLNTIIIQKEQG